MAGKISSSNLFSKGYVALILVNAAFIGHLIDEIIHEEAIAPTVVYIVLFLSLVFYPFSNKWIKIFILVASAIGCSSGVIINHIFPLLTRGVTEGVITSLLVIFASIYSLYRATVLLRESSQK